MNSALALVAPRTIQQQIREGLWAPRLGAALFGIFGMLGLVLAAVGIYGVTSYMVAQRTCEIGIRLALGATPREVLMIVLGQSLRLTLGGILAGLTGAFFLARFTKSLLFQVSPADPVTLAATALILIAVAGVAGWLPGWRASRIDPILALREPG